MSATEYERYDRCIHTDSHFTFDIRDVRDYSDCDLERSKVKKGCGCHNFVYVYTVDIRVTVRLPR